MPHEKPSVDQWDDPPSGAPQGAKLTFLYRSFQGPIFLDDMGVSIIQERGGIPGFQLILGY